MALYIFSIRLSPLLLLPIAITPRYYFCPLPLLSITITLHYYYSHYYYSRCYYSPLLLLLVAITPNYYYSLAITITSPMFELLHVEAHVDAYTNVTSSYISPLHEASTSKRSVVPWWTFRRTFWSVVHWEWAIMEENYVNLPHRILHAASGVFSSRGPFAAVNGISRNHMANWRMANIGLRLAIRTVDHRRRSSAEKNFSGRRRGSQCICRWTVSNRSNHRGKGNEFVDGV